ncbi:MAG: tRNA uridine-5-carboxymethylaminomethyl(34) synthesis GTPase MnmE [Lentimicrobiaceae bacterium]|nr:tRNA uridine-5-carboxymethylaminomethyl(34) synthesis GTPase MnmE [Lentimicrobiaceae bacterium]
MFSPMYSSGLRDTICALSTAPGMAAIAVIRISGEKTFETLTRCFSPGKKELDLINAPSHTLHLGWITGGTEVVDEVLLGIFRAPHSYTGEDVAEISCHGSLYIQRRIIEILIEQGIRLAQPGEFTLRAFLNHKYDLSQAEAIADLIASHSKSSHDLAIKQMRGGFSQTLKYIREQLVGLASLLELELDFSEEDVEFANRNQLIALVTTLQEQIETLISSFTLGNVMKNGIPVAIIGAPNVGKSTLLNALLNEERAIVSEIPGTTRDSIEDVITHNGISFRFIDTAGLREAQDTIESIGIERTYEKINSAAIILYVFDINTATLIEIREVINDLLEHIEDKNKRIILIGNKTDLLVESPHNFSDLVEMETIFISAKRKENINLIIESLLKPLQDGTNIYDATIVSNLRHYEALKLANSALAEAREALQIPLSTDLIAEHIRMVLHHLGEITGEITTDEILGNIFSNFCIGK